jgi:hypothetical protein
MALEPDLSEIVQTQHRRFESSLVHRVGNRMAPGGVGKLGQMRKLSLSSFSYSLPELAAEVAEAGKGLRRIPFLAHEEQRNLGQ